MSLLLGIFTFILIIVSLFMMLVILMQRSKSDGGLGASLGGGMAESTFGAETNTVLFNATRNAAIAFFVLSFGLYLGHLWVRNHAEVADSGLPDAAPALSPVGTEVGVEAGAPLIEFPTTEEPVAAPVDDSGNTSAESPAP
ncbi:MAG: preprotein translocase subunit SecG [Opitutaceae bacterium]